MVVVFNTLTVGADFYDCSEGTLLVSTNHVTATQVWSQTQSRYVYFFYNQLAKLATEDLNLQYISPKKPFSCTQKRHVSRYGRNGKKWAKE